MGYNARNYEIRDNVGRMHRAWEAEQDALATVRSFNATLSANGRTSLLPKIAATNKAKHPWVVIACDTCGMVTDLDLRVKPRDPEASICVALRMCAARDVMSMVGLGLLGWRGGRQFEVKCLLLNKADIMAGYGKPGFDP